MARAYPFKCSASKTPREASALCQQGPTLASGVGLRVEAHANRGPETSALDIAFRCPGPGCSLSEEGVEQR